MTLKPLPGEGKRFIRKRAGAALACADSGKNRAVEALLDEGVTRAELAKRPGCSRQVLDRLVDFLHTSKIEQVERALAVLGLHLSVSVQAA